jgi:hypothetical protein
MSEIKVVPCRYCANEGKQGFKVDVDGIEYEHIFKSTGRACGTEAEALEKAAELRKSEDAALAGTGAPKECHCPECGSYLICKLHNFRYEPTARPVETRPPAPTFPLYEATKGIAPMENLEQAAPPRPRCLDCGRVQDDKIHLDSEGDRWGAALHWFKSPAAPAAIEQARPLLSCQNSTTLLCRSMNCEPCKRLRASKIAAAAEPAPERRPPHEVEFTVESTDKRAWRVTQKCPRVHNCEYTNHISVSQNAGRARWKIYIDSHVEEQREEYSVSMIVDGREAMRAIGKMLLDAAEDSTDDV